MILIIDDDIGIRTSLSMMLKRAGYDVSAVASPKEAMTAVRHETPQLIMLDMNFSLSTSGDEGLTLLKQIRLFVPDVPVILMTAWGSIQLAVKGMRAGAFDFVTKPWNNVALMEKIEVALEIKPTERTGGTKRTVRNINAAKDSHECGIIGSSPALLNVLDTVRRVAPTNAPVLITGESGTGKELIAEALHRNSKRAGERFVKVNLGGMSQSLFESEMFGYRKGAFTGAASDRAGRFETADRGTIFLDEIGDLDMASQVKLLRVLQDQTFEPLGDSRPHKVNVRVVCATNANLPQLIKEGRFREDLFYRINLITVHLPALCERKDDIPQLAAHFASRLCETNGMPQVRITDDAIAYLKAYSFPGNIRQLKNIIERAVLMSGKDTVTATDIEPLDTHEPADRRLPYDNRTSDLNLEQQERAAITQAMRECNGNISRMADLLGLSRAALYRRLEKYGFK